MVALILVVLAVIAFGIIGVYLGYNMGFDNGFETALECLEKEVEECTK